MKRKKATLFTGETMLLAVQRQVGTEGFRGGGWEIEYRGSSDSWVKIWSRECHSVIPEEITCDVSVLARFLIPTGEYRVSPVTFAFGVRPGWTDFIILLGEDIIEDLRGTDQFRANKRDLILEYLESQYGAKAARGILAGSRLL